jgi:hypothetical protein
LPRAEPRATGHPRAHDGRCEACEEAARAAAEIRAVAEQAHAALARLEVVAAGLRGLSCARAAVDEAEQLVEAARRVEAQLKPTDRSGS